MAFRGSRVIWETISVKFSNRAVLTAVLAALLAVAVFLGTIPMLAVVALLTAAFALGWSHLLRLPAVGGSTLVVILSGLGAVACVAVTPDEPWLRFLPIVLAMAVFLAFINEMLRPVPRTELVESLIGTISGVIVSVCAVGWLATIRLPGGDQLAVAGAAALAVAAAMSALPFARGFVRLMKVLAAAIAGAIVAYLLPDLNLVSGAVMGVLSALVLMTVNLLFGSLPSVTSKYAWLSVFTLPIMVVGILMYVVGRVLT
jgi:hypothetical protein